MSGDQAGIEVVKAWAKVNPEKLKERNIQLKENRAVAECQVLSTSSGYIITSPRDPDDPAKARPWVKNIEGHNKEDLEKLFMYLSKIAHWHFVLRLHNPVEAFTLGQLIEWELNVEPRDRYLA